MIKVEVIIYQFLTKTFSVGLCYRIPSGVENPLFILAKKWRTLPIKPGKAKMTRTFH
jgi:hypothetical protein